MNSTLVKTWLRWSAVAFGIAWAAITPVQAKVIITGSYDPVYGLPFSGTSGSMYWAGTANFVFGDNCVLPTNNGSIDTQLQPACVMTVEQAVVDLYTGNPTNNGAKFATLSFAGAANIGLANFVGGQLTGVYSDYFDPWQTATLANAGVDPFSVSNFAFNLAFSTEGATLFHDSLTDNVDRHKNHIDRGVFWRGKGYGHLKDSYCNPDRSQISTATCGYSENIARVTFSSLQVVPEPAPLALMLAGGLVGLAATRRRRPD